MVTLEIIRSASPVPLDIVDRRQPDEPLEVLVRHRGARGRAAGDRLDVGPVHAGEGAKIPAI
ncbi:MAG: hypothetical protein AAGF23_05665 [Acidobacteriota bacterium]